MAILFRSTPAATARWRPLLGALLPEHEIRYWPEIGDRAAIESLDVTVKDEAGVVPK